MSTPTENLPREVLVRANSDELMRWPLERIRQALIAELKGPRRTNHLRRLHQRFSMLRKNEERRELERAAKKQEIPGFLQR